MGHALFILPLIAISSNNFRKVVYVRESHKFQPSFEERFPTKRVDRWQVRKGERNRNETKIYEADIEAPACVQPRCRLVDSFTHRMKKRHRHSPRECTKLGTIVCHMWVRLKASHKHIAKLLLFASHFSQLKLLCPELMGQSITVGELKSRHTHTLATSKGAYTLFRTFLIACTARPTRGPRTQYDLRPTSQHARSRVSLEWAEKKSYFMV